MTDWERLQVAAVYRALKQVYFPRKPHPVQDPILERIADRHVRINPTD